MTLRDLAEKLGCSHMTVSRALRGEPGVSRAEVERIRAAADALGYRPNPLVSALMSSRRQAHPARKTANMAFLHFEAAENGWQNALYLRELFGGARDRAASLGFHLDPVWGAESGLSKERLCKTLLARGISGIVLAPLPGNIHRLRFAWDRFAVAAMGFSLIRPALHRAGTYQYHSIPRALRELRRLGYRRVGIGLSALVNARMDNAWEASIAAYAAAQPRNRLPVFRPRGARKTDIGRWLHRHKIDAFINAGVGGLRQEIAHAGFRIPQDLGYVGLLDVDHAATVRPDWPGIGAATVDLVYGQLMRNERGLPAKPKTVLIEAEWDPGRTVRRVRD